MSLKSIIFFLLSVIVICCSCSSRQQQVLFEQQASSLNTTKADTTVTSYKIKPQDLIQIRNLQNPKYIVDEPATSVSAAAGFGNNLGQTYQVEDDGTVALPMIGHVKVTGLTRHGAATQIETLYRKELKDPIIELKIVNLKVTVLGEVTKQGTYPLVKDRTPLVEIIGEAGGLTDRANSQNLKIIRGVNENQQVIEVDLSKLKTLSDVRTILQNDDIIYVAQNKRAIRSKNVLNVSTLLQPVLLLLNTALIIYTLAR